MTDTYPRDLHGYGGRPPDPAWPDDAVLALQFVLNYEEGGENNVLHGDPASEAFLSEIVGAEPWPGRRHMNMESIYEYGARAGFWRLHALFTRHAIPLTVYGVATALQRGPAQVEAMQAADWEIASHALKWIDYKDVPADEERRQLYEAIRIHTEVTGNRPLGWYTGRTSENTLALVMEEGGFLYSADAYADDLPYWHDHADGPQLIVPYTLDANDMRFATAQGFNTAEHFFAYLRDSFDVLYAEGLEGAPKMMSVGLHCRLAGRPGRLHGLQRFIEHVQAHDRVWCARRIDIARHWHRHHAPAGLRPSGMNRAMFVERFGDVFEHSPWIAEAAHRAGLGAGEDDASGLHRAMVAVLRKAGAAEKTALIKAHPDLAGRLALAGDVTADSSREQASAGLDRLGADELARLTRLNEAYKARFGTPFVMAVKGRSKDEVLAAIEARLAHDAETEFATALAEIEQIALLRLQDRVPQEPRA